MPAMVDKANWEHMKKHAFEAFSSNGRLDVSDLEQIVNIGCNDGGFDEDEKIVLINIISNMTRADLNDAMWAKVAELISKFELEHDKEATVDSLAEDP